MSDASSLRHRTRPMRGRDPHEQHRASTTLELLFDLTFVVAFGTAANELAHNLVDDHVSAGIVGFAFATFAVSWAWINFTWFASAYDTDDWLYRLTTMLQMVGVLIFALGLPTMFKSLHEGDTLDNDVMVWGYVVMRVAMIFQWWRANRQDPDRRAVHGIYIASIVLSQAMWCALAIIDLPIRTTAVLLAVPLLIELAGPFVAERRYGGTPWHAHHIAERYGLMVIIALGEGMIGTMASLTAFPELNLDVALLAAAGTALTFGMWWTYFSIPHGDILHRARDRSFAWGYGHIPLFGAIVAVGAGLHAAAYFLEDPHHVSLGRTGAVLTVAVPLAFYLLALYVFYAIVSKSVDPFHLLLIVGTVVALVVPVVMAENGADLTWCLLTLAIAPWVTVLGYEAVGYRHNAEVLAGLED